VNLLRKLLSRTAAPGLAVLALALAVLTPAWAHWAALGLAAVALGLAWRGHRDLTTGAVPR
jgi:hypothetical protein